ncbi:PAS domain S-box protein [Rhodobacteraceae bacterium G21628-S1]|nr:PAS domain S-box protein [Rhodobacteraceae bacterium G21628-S1]
MDRDQIARKLFEDMPDALVVADRKGIIRVWNGGAERIFGFSEGEALGQSLDIITPERLRERLCIGYEATMRTGQTKYGAGDLLSVPAIRRDGAQISIQFSIVPVERKPVILQQTN